MSKDICDFLHGNACLDQPAPNAVSQNMGSPPTRIIAATGMSGTDSIANDTRTNGFNEWSAMPQKYRPALGDWAAVSQVLCNCPAGPGRQRKHICSSRLARR